MTSKEMVEVYAKAALEICMKSLKEKDRDLNLTGKCKKCYDYIAEQFIRNYIDGKSMFDIMDDTMSDRFYSTWLASLKMVKHIVRDGGKFHGSIGRGIEDIVNNSGISRKTWMKFLDYYIM